MGTDNKHNQPMEPVEADSDPSRQPTSNLLRQDTEIEAASASSFSTSACLGTLLKDRYLIERVIGRGGIGVVYLARDQQLVKRPVVIKVLHESVIDSELAPWFSKKFQHEIEALSRIDHPGVVGVFDIGELPDGRAYFVMQYVEGITLRRAIGEHGMDLERVAQLIKQMGQALSAAHDKGVLHRDLKPENIMLQNLGEGEEQVKLIDFGIARVADPKIAPATQATRVAGTPPYMAPEQIRGRPSAASDIFALGAIAYEMITGLMPFKADTQVGLYEAEREGVEIKPREVRPALPEAAEAAVLKALSFDEKERYTRARDFGDELSRALLGERAPLSSDQFGLPSGSRMPVDLFTSEGPGRLTGAEVRTRVEPARKKRVAVLALIAAAALMAVVAVIAALWPKPEPPKPEPPVTIIAPPAPQRSLGYWVVVQKYRNRKPYQQPQKLAGDILFDEGDQVHLGLSSEQTGFLYLINEGPKPVRNLPAYNLLFPKPSFNKGSAELKVGQEVNTPKFVFDGQRGTEKLWLVWSAEPVSELEAVKGVVNRKDRGTISKPDQIRIVRDLLDKYYAASQPVVEKDEVNRQALVKGSGETLVHLVKLEHY